MLKEQHTKLKQEHEALLAQKQKLNETGGLLDSTYDYESTQRNTMAETDRYMMGGKHNILDNLGLDD